MVENQVNELHFNGSAQISSAKHTLPTKIIQLRKSSQEKHVRRMKLAYLKKDMKELIHISSCVSPSFPRKFSSSSKSLFSTPMHYQSRINSTLSRRETFEKFPPLAKSDNAPVKHIDSCKCNSDKEIAETKRNESILSCNKNIPSSDSPRYHNYDFHSINKHKFVAEKDFLNTEFAFRNKKNMPLTGNKLVFSQCNKKENDRKNDDLFKRKRNPQRVLNNTEEIKSNETLLPRRKPSKIPILKSNLKLKNKFMENKCHREEIPSAFAERCVESVYKELSFKQSAKKDDHDNHLDEFYSFPNIMHHCFEDEPCENLYEKFCEQELHNDMSLNNKWMNDALDNSASSKNSSLTLKFQDLTLASPTREENSMSVFKEEKNSEPLISVKASGVYEIYDAISPTMKSDNSSKWSCEIEESNNARNKQKVKHLSDINIQGVSNITNLITKSSDLEADNYQQLSGRKSQNCPNTSCDLRYPQHNLNSLQTESPETFILSSNKNLEVADHRYPASRSLPNYPNTSCNFQYSRCKFKGINNNFHFLQTDSPESITLPSEKDFKVTDDPDYVFRNLPDYPKTPYNLRYPRLNFKELKKSFKSFQTDPSESIKATSGKDLEVAAGPNPVYRNLPDYPNTPYNLRYPRFKFKALYNSCNSFQIDSYQSVEAPSKKNSELVDYRYPVYRNSLDYPKTPYNLRCPRYKFRRFNFSLNSFQVESPARRNRANTLKTPRKRYCATPKRLKSGKKKKIKRQILRARETWT